MRARCDRLEALSWDEPRQALADERPHAIPARTGTTLHVRRRPDRTVATPDHNIPTTDRSLPIADPISKQQIETLVETIRAELAKVD